MKLKQYEIDRILDLRRRLRMGSEAIAKQLGHSKNTAKKYLRQYGLLSYTYLQYQGGPPSLVTSSKAGSYHSTAEINELKQRGGRLVTKLDETFVLLDEANRQIQALTEEGAQKEKKRKEAEEMCEATSKKLEEHKRLYTESQNELQEERQKKDELNRQINEELPGLRQEKENLMSENKELKDILAYKKGENEKKGKKIEALEKTLKEVLEPPVTPQVSPSPQIESTINVSIPIKEEMEKSNTGVDWLLVGVHALAAGLKAFLGAYKPQTTNFQTVGLEMVQDL
jgi:chromosome segregation ATPase